MFPAPYEQLSGLSAPGVLDFFGWTPALSLEEAALRQDLDVARFADPLPARVVAAHRGGVEVIGGFGVSPVEVLTTDLYEAVVVGDWVLCARARANPAIGGPLYAVAQFSRATCLERRAAGEVIRPQGMVANADLVFLVQGLDRDFNPRRLERGVALVRGAGLSAIVVLTKQDLCEPSDLEQHRRAATAVAPDCPVLAVSSLTGVGLLELSQYLKPKQTCVLIGSSGAGKSTLLNLLMQREVQPTGIVRESDSRGRHITTARRLLPLPTGGSIVDTPGMRELGLWEADGLNDGFPEIARLVEGCRFRDCSHSGEPGCAVAGALDSGELSQGRWDSFLKLQREDEYLRSKVDQQAARARNQEQKHIRAGYRQVQAERRKARGRDR